MSEATLGQLVVQLVADTVRFEGDLGKAAEIARDKMEEIHGFFKSNLALVSTELAGFSAGLIEVLHAGAERSDDLRSMAETLGLTVTSMSQLAFAAKQADVPIDVLQQGMKQLAKNVAEASAGNLDAIRRFDALGIAFRDVHGNLLPMDQVLKNTAGAFAGLEDSPVKTADALLMMGRAGEQLLPLLNEGGKSLEEMRKKSDELGFTISTTTAKNLQEFDDKWKELTSVWQGARTEFAGEIAPMFKDLIQYLEDANSKFAPFTKSAEIIKGGFHVAGEAIDTVKGIVHNTGVYFDELWDKMKKGDIVGVLKAPVSFIKSDISSIQQGVKDAIAGTAQLAEAAQKAGEDAKKHTAPDLSFDKTSITQQYDEIYRELDKQTTESTLRQSHTFSEMAENFKGSMKHFETDFYHIWGDLDDIGQQGAMGIAQDFESFLVNTAQEGFKGLLKAWITTIEQMIAKAATAELFNALFKGSAGGSTTGLGGLFTSFLGMGITGAKAGGGPVAGGSTYLVGENGPELFTPSSGGMIIPNGAGGGGQTNFIHTYNIDAKGADADRIQRILPSMMEQTRMATKRDIYDAFRRSGLPAPRFA